MKTIKKILKWTGVILLILIITGFALYMIYLRPFKEKMKEISIIKYGPELTVVTGGGGNSGILVSDSLVVVIDTKMDEAADDLFKMVKELGGNKPILVINTHYHPDHCGGNALYKGQTIIAGANYGEEFWKEEAGEETMPTKWLKDRMDIRMGDDTLTIYNLAKDVHTQSDVVVYLHKRKMLFTGDVILNKQAPVLMGKADPDGYLWAMDDLPKEFQIEKIVPGHGAVGGMEIITNFKQYFADMQAAADDESKEDSLVAKYESWTQLPFFMSPEATIHALKEKKERD